jgi:hypothetical protein
VCALLSLEPSLELGLVGVERVEHGGADERADRPRHSLRQVLLVDSGVGRRSLVLLRRRLRYRCGRHRRGRLRSCGGDACDPCAGWRRGECDHCAPAVRPFQDARVIMGWELRDSVLTSFGDESDFAGGINTTHFV